MNYNYTIEANKHDIRSCTFEVCAANDLQALDDVKFMASEADFDQTDQKPKSEIFLTVLSKILDEEGQTELNKKVDHLFEELRECYAVTVDNKLHYVSYYHPEDRVGDTTQPLVTLTDEPNYLNMRDEPVETLVFEPSDVEKIKFADYKVLVWLKDNGHRYSFQFLKAKKVGEK